MSIFNCGTAEKFKWSLKCDYCTSYLKGSGGKSIEMQDPGDLADKARECGFSTRLIDRELPLNWVCPSCK